MKAVQISKFGGPEVLQYIDVPDPVPGKGEVLVQVQAAGVNFRDIYERTGFFPTPLPSVLGSEAGGVVRRVGPEVTQVKEGDLVAYCSVPKAYAQ